MSIRVERLSEGTLADCIEIWNEVVEEGMAFPQREKLTQQTGREFFLGQSYVGVAVDGDSGPVVGLYILHPNNVGRCGHICNASYALRGSCRGRHMGAVLVQDCMEKARELGFRILQFNAVVKSNEAALRLYRRLGFHQLGVIPGGFLNIRGEYEDIIPHYIEL